MNQFRAIPSGACLYDMAHDRPGGHLETAEHIVLESDIRELARAESPRRVHATLHCHSSLRRRHLSLSIIDYYYLAVRVGRNNRPHDYVLDLRFVDSSIALTRHVPWRWILGASVLAASAAATAWYATVLAPKWSYAATLSATLLALTTCACLVVVFRLVETLALRSIHGRATVLVYRGGPGTLRAVRPFMRKLAAHIRLAAAARRPTKAEHLRDELREHHRLKEAGVLQQEVYDASKALILAQHTRARTERGSSRKS